jgi:hypothetical protein
MPPPGAPELAWIRAPGILPCSALSRVPVGARVSSLPLTVATALGRFCRSMPVDCPLTTTSSSLKTSGSRATSAVAWSIPNVSVLDRNPMARTTTTSVSSGALSVYRPSGPAWATIRVPCTAIVASAMPSPVWALVTVPLTWRTCAAAGGPTRVPRATTIPHQRCAMAPPCWLSVEWFSRSRGVD